MFLTAAHLHVLVALIRAQLWAFWTTKPQVRARVKRFASRVSCALCIERPYVDLCSWQGVLSNGIHTTWAETLHVWKKYFVNVIFYLDLSTCLPSSVEVKVKVLPVTSHWGPEGEYRCSPTLSWPRHLDGFGWSAPRPGRFTPGKDPVPIVQEAGWAPGPVWTGAENLAPTGIRSPDRPARSESLYRLSSRSPSVEVPYPFCFRGGTCSLYSVNVHSFPLKLYYLYTGVLR